MGCWLLSSKHHIKKKNHKNCPSRVIQWLCIMNNTDRLLFVENLLHSIQNIQKHWKMHKKKKTMKFDASWSLNVFKWHFKSVRRKYFQQITTNQNNFKSRNILCGFVFFFLFFLVLDNIHSSFSFYCMEKSCMNILQNIYCDWESFFGGWTCMKTHCVEHETDIF